MNKKTLIRAYPYRIELHMHTSPVSSCADFDPATAVSFYQRCGADAVVITNHAHPSIKSIPKDEWIAWYMSDFLAAKEKGDELGVRVLLGMEARFPGSANDYLVYGVDESFLEQAWELMDTDIHTFYAACSADHRVIVQAHPFREGMVRADSADVDGIEVFNLHPGHNSRIGFAARHATEHRGVITGGTDFHHLHHEGMIFARFQTLPADSFELARLLKSGDYLFQIGDSLILP